MSSTFGHPRCNRSLIFLKINQIYRISVFIRPSPLINLHHAKHVAHLQAPTSTHKVPQNLISTILDHMTPYFTVSCIVFATFADCWTKVKQRCNFIYSGRTSLFIYMLVALHLDINPFSYNA